MTTATATREASGPRDPQRGAATFFGATLVALGVVDASGVLSNSDRLLGVFRIPPSINVVHVLTGLLGLGLARYVGGATLFNKLGGVIYGAVALGGIVSILAGRGGVNWPTNALHLLLAVLVAAVGFEGGRRRPT
ncbi:MULTISPECIES: DUF4383 domain-containing protein [Natrialbaceae]|uniref:DUF4383 domain-containing protein n=1 Tax=Natrialbaceae TaxID=1644061 RepID=UPI00207CF8CA|nr:DUF4383 domain-containing protein [Natronococcus sp. CG52]